MTTIPNDAGDRVREIARELTIRADTHHLSQLGYTYDNADAAIDCTAAALLEVLRSQGEPGWREIDTDPPPENPKDSYLVTDGTRRWFSVGLDSNDKPTHWLRVGWPSSPPAGWR